VPRKPKAGTILGAFGKRAPRRVLVAELVGAVVLITLDDAAAGNAPTAQSYVGAFVVFLVLGFAAEISEDAAHVAAGLGGLVLLALAMRSAGAITKGAAALGPPPPLPRHPHGVGTVRRPRSAMLSTLRSPGHRPAIR
jgi:hypothetical protein